MILLAKIVLLPHFYVADLHTLLASYSHIEYHTIPLIDKIQFYHL